MERSPEQLGHRSHLQLPMFSQTDIYHSKNNPKKIPKSDIYSLNLAIYLI